MQVQSSYKVMYLEYGVIIKGSVPASDLIDLIEMVKKKHGYDYQDFKIAKCYRATLCLTTEEKAPLWRAEIAKQNDLYGTRLENSKKIENFRNSRVRSTSIT